MTNREETKGGLVWWHGAAATVLGVLYILFGGNLLVPLLGRMAGYTVGLALLIIAAVFTVLSRTKIKEVVPMALPPVRQFFGAIGMYIGVFFFNTSISAVLSRIIPDFSAREDAINAFIKTMSPAVALIVIALLPALCEEIFCRGYLTRCFRAVGKDWLVILLTAVIFGALHMDLFAFLPTATLGALFAYVALQTKSLLIPMILHFLNNAFSVVIVYLSGEAAEQASQTLEKLNLWQTISVFFLYIGLGLLFFWFSHLLFHKKKLFVKSSLAVFLLASFLFTGGLVSTVVETLSHVEIISFNSENVKYSESETVSFTFTVEEEGEYLITATGMGADPSRFVLTDGEGRMIEETLFAGYSMMNVTLELKPGGYTLMYLVQPEAPSETERIAAVSYQVTRINR